MSQSISLLGATYSAVPAVLLPKSGGGTARFDDCSVVTAGASDVASGKIFVASDGTVTTGTASGGGGSGIGTLLATESLGTITTTSTSAVSTGKSVTVNNAGDYDLLIVECSIDSISSSNQFLASVTLILMTASSNISSRSGASSLSNKLYFIRTNGIDISKSSTTSYGVYPTSTTFQSATGKLTFSISCKYSSSYTNTIDAAYTARVYGVKLYDLIGG